MSIVVWLILGLVIGVVAGQFGGSQRQDRGVAVFVLVAALGALMGGFIASVLRDLDVNGVNATSSLVAALGALLMIGLIRAVPPMDVYE